MKKKLLLLLVVFLLVVSIIPVYAKENSFFADETLNLEKNFDQTTFMAGNLINYKGQIDGISFAAGNNVNMTSSQDYAFVAGRYINLTDFNAKDVFVAGQKLVFENASLRVLYATGETINFDGKITKDAYLAGDKVVINGTIDGDVTVASEKLELGDNAVINGTLKYPKDANAKISELAVVANTKTYKSTSISKEKGKSNEFVSKLTSWILSYIALLIVALIFMAINKKFFDKVTKLGTNVKDSIKLMLFGLIILIVVPIVAVIAMIGVVTIPLCILTLILYGVLIYLSMIPTAYYLGNLLLKDKIKNKYLLLTVSLLCLYILKVIPIIGGIIIFLSLIFGLGVYYTLIKEKIHSK